MKLVHVLPRLDEHLKTLQSLSAHLKLLLDAPEHLWRLLEKKEHLQAAWLFLLARVVHRALITDDPEGGWENEGISVLVKVIESKIGCVLTTLQTQFPLVQRQWDTVAQFRPQIAHRATQYLREASTSSEVFDLLVLFLQTLNHSYLRVHVQPSSPFTSLTPYPYQKPSLRCSPSALDLSTPSWHAI